MNKFTRAKSNTKSEVEEFIDTFKGKYTDLIAENGKIISVTTSDTDGKTWLTSKGLAES